MSRLRRGGSIAATLVSVALVAAACGSTSTGATTGPSSSSPAGSTTGAGSPATTKAASGTPIAIGSIGSYSGPESSSLVGVQATLRAWVSETNAAGGIDGHPVKLYLDDDGGVASTAVTDVQTLLTQDHVVAIVGDASSSDTAWAPIVQKAGVPVIGGIPISLVFGTNPDFYAGGANLLALNYGTVAAAKSDGAKLGYLYCAEIAQCKQTLVLIRGLAAAIGEQVPYAASVSATVPDYTATCQALRSAGVSSYQIGDNSSVVLRIADQCRQEGLAARLLVFDGTVTPQFATNSGANGFQGTEADFPFFDTSTAATRAYHAALKKYASGVSSVGNPDSVYMWVAGKLLQAAIQASGSTTVTSASIKKGLYALKGTTLGGLTPPLSYTPGQSAQIDCYFQMGASNGHFTEPQGLRTSCAPAPLISAVFKKL